MSSGTDRQLIDEKGRVFGIVNIVDVLVIILMVAILAGGYALLSSADTEQEAGSEVTDRYVTLEFGPQPSYIASEITVGDGVKTGGGDQLTITDVYRYELMNGSTVVLARAQMTGTIDRDVENPQFQFGNTPVRIGQSISFTTDTYETTPKLARISLDGEQLPTTTIAVELETTVSHSVASAIEVGDEYTIAGETIGTVADVDLLNEITQRQPVRLTVDLKAIERGGTIQFADRTVRVGTTLPFRTAEYELTGEVTSVTR